ncbi:MAG: PorV/PorQ family protein [Elusimicrobia bacterium]|nr:PorV/PorQ family protein [Elusimicrobiota bacterium]
MLKICVLTVLSLLSAAENCAAASSEGTSGGQFLRVGVSARAAALGDSGAALSGVQGIFYNPAGLTGVSGTELYFSQVNWILDASYSNLAFAKPAGDGVYGAAVSYLSTPPTDKYDKLGNKLSDTYSSADMAVTAGYSRRLGDRTALGVNLKYISSKLDTESASAVAADAGIIYAAIPAKLNLGLVVQNAGTKLSYRSSGDPLPLTVKAGGQYRLNLGNDRNIKKDMTFFADLNDMKDAGLYGSLGVDFLTAYAQGGAFSVRAGYRTNGGGTGAGVSAGLGLDMGSYVIDYAYAPMGDLGNTHRFSLTYKFGVKTRS